MNSYIFAGIMLFIVMAIIELLLFAWRSSRDVTRTERVLGRLQENRMNDVAENILKTRVISSIPFLNRLLLKINFVERIEILVRQSSATQAPAVYLMAALLLCVIGFMVGSFWLQNIGMGLLLGFIGIFAPFFWLFLKKSLRLKKFTMQLPDALDMIARSLKAGHSFSSGLKFVSENFPDPIGLEFAETIRQINFGLPVAEALKNLGKRVGSSDLNFFIMATILQRDTGGNLAEITQTIATLIRERFKFEDRVRVLAAEGKISAAILIALPFVVFLFVLNTTPGYVQVLMEDPFAQKVCVGAILLMLTGIIVIAKMIRIKV
jgi:tight adherence protein B